MASLLPPPRCSADPSGTDVPDTSAAIAKHDALVHDTTPASSSYSHSRSACSTSNSNPTNAFDGLVAWFCSRDIHPTARYAWTFHRGTLASLPGIESGEQPVDVIFAKPSDPMLQSLYDLSIPVLNPAYIHASLNSGELLAIRPYQLTASTIAGSKNRTSMTSSPVVTMSRDAQGTPKDSMAPLPPSPENLQVQDTILSQSEIALRGSVLSPKRPAVAPQAIVKSFQPKKTFVCQGTCPELTCEHRSDLRIHNTIKKKNGRSPFLDLSGYSPAPKKHPAAAALPLVKQEKPTEISTKSIAPADELFNRRLAIIKREIDVLKAPIQRRYKSPIPTVHESTAPRRDKDLLRYQESTAKLELRSPYATKEQSSKLSLDQAAIEAYRKEYLAPSSVFKVISEEHASDVMKSSNHTLSMMKLQVKGEEEESSIASYQYTPLSLKRKTIQTDLNAGVEYSPSRFAKPIKHTPKF